MRIVLLRHGRTEANDRWLYCGSTDLPLTEAGREELRELRDAGGYPEIAGMTVYTSGLTRTEETLSVLYGEVPHSALTALREMDFGDFEMHSYEELKESPVYRAWCEGDNEANPTPGGESGILMQRRVIDCIDRLIGRGEDFLAVSHGGPLAAIMQHFFPDEGKNRYEWQPRNGRGFLITIDDRIKTWQPVPEGGERNG